jgi:hypothetical protein
LATGVLGVNEHVVVLHADDGTHIVIFGAAV